MIPSKRFTLQAIERITGAGDVERIDFNNGVNLLVGRPNTGKTVWLRMLDYVLGDPDPAEQALSEELATKYDLIRVAALIDEEEVRLERRWKEPGAKHKVFVDGIPVGSRELSFVLLERLGVPVLHYPQGDPYAARAWPELSWRSLFRHMYRRQVFWGGLVDRQPDSEQHACILQFLGLADHLFSTDYAELVEAQRSRITLEAQREGFMRMLNEVSEDLLDFEGQLVGVTPEAISEVVGRIDGELAQLRAQREERLAALISESPPEGRGRLRDLGEERAQLLAEHAKVAAELRTADARWQDMSDYTSELDAEVERQDRALASDTSLSGLRITHCPACDQPITGSNDSSETCFLCRRTLPRLQDENENGRKRLEVSIQQLRSERDETVRLVDDLAGRRRELVRDVRGLSERIAEVESDLERLRQPLAAILPPELAQLDVQAGRLEERRRQWDRVRNVLSRREELAGRIATIQARVDELDEEVERRAQLVDFHRAADLLADGMNDYLTRLNQARPGAWSQSEISLSLNDRRFSFKVGGERWDRRLGGTLTLYFLLAYQYSLLRLTREVSCHYPGLTVLDMPAELPEGESVADLENFVLIPFVRLLSEEGMENAQVIVAGSSFEGLENARRIELEHVFR